MASLASSIATGSVDAPKARMRMRTLRVAIIGAGYWGKNYVRILRELSLYPMSVELPDGTDALVQLECAAVCDLSQVLCHIFVSICVLALPTYLQNLYHLYLFAICLLHPSLYKTHDVLLALHSFGSLPCQALLDKVSMLHPGTRVTLDMEEVLQDSTVKAVIVATPASTHFTVVTKCIDAGKHVLVEKPMTLKSETGI